MYFHITVELIKVVFSFAKSEGIERHSSKFMWRNQKNRSKSSYLRQHYPDSIYYDLPSTHEITYLTCESHLLYGEIKASSEVRTSEPI